MRPALSMRSYSRIAGVALAAGIAALSITCSGDEPTHPSTDNPGAELLVAGPPARVTVTHQPPTSALDQEVWAPAAQPIAAVKDAAGVGVAGVVVTATILSGTGTLQGQVNATTRANGTAHFTDLGIDGTGPHTLRFVTGTLGANSTTIALNPLPPEAGAGKWDPPVDWDIVPLHMQLLPTRKILAWGKREPTGGMGMPRLWDPAVGPPTTATMIRVDTMLFCSGHTLMADGRVMVAGGHKGDDRGLDVTNIFDPVTETWVPGLPKMAKGRWYPSVTTIGD
ncbi:MAG TPA: kelch repeat-containing protein, partial [Gemmatimonadales bacterium]|nr:kelch repeat-containing protein [Gemmatimonadales bacterium]